VIHRITIPSTKDKQSAYTSNEQMNQNELCKIEMFVVNLHPKKKTSTANKYEYQ
jgi:hypothetical protein